MRVGDDGFPSRSGAGQGNGEFIVGLECGAEQGLDLIHQAQKQRIEMADKWLGQGVYKTRGWTMLGPGPRSRRVGGINS